MKIEVHSYQKQEHRHRGNHIHYCPQLPNHPDHLVQDYHDRHDHLVQDHQGCLHVQPQLDSWSRLSSENSHHSILQACNLSIIRPLLTFFLFVIIIIIAITCMIIAFVILKVKTIRVDDRNIAIQLWDTAGTFQL